LKPIILDGKKTAQTILENLKKEIDNNKQTLDKIPGLAVILVGNNPASQAYVEMKKKRCKDVGIDSFSYDLPKEYGEKKLLELIQELNENPKVNGILVQLPLPPDYDKNKVINAIDPKKDVDCFHPINVGKLLLGQPGLKPCTPQGIYELLKHYNIPVQGKHIVIVGRSNIVGKPLAAIFVQKEEHANATVTICHSKSENLKKITITADILIAATGKPKTITTDMVKDNATIIDVGSNRITDPTTPRGYRFIGDTNLKKVSKKIKAYTPSPGGVGPMTIAMLIKNTYEAFINQQQK
jgi:methylenetetrahydrofolate dehydrogenase (NADP+) / methenyltetrahydrofolate cyclohydrolase